MSKSKWLKIVALIFACLGICASIVDNKILSATSIIISNMYIIASYFLED